MYIKKKVVLFFYFPLTPSTLAESKHSSSIPVPITTVGSRVIGKWCQGTGGVVLTTLWSHRRTRRLWGRRRISPTNRCSRKGLLLLLLLSTNTSMCMAGSGRDGEETSVVTKRNLTNISVNTTRSSSRKKHSRSTWDLQRKKKK